MYTTVSIVCIIYMSVLALVTTFKMVSGSRKKRLEYIKSFKSGKAALIYAAAFPLYLIAGIYNSGDVYESFLSGVSATIKLIVFEYNVELVHPLLQNQAFAIAINMCYVLAAANILIFSASLVGQKTMNFLRTFLRTLSIGEVYVVVGDDVNNLSIIKSVKNKGRVIYLCSPSEEVQEELFLNKVPYVNFKRGDDLGKILNSLFGSLYKNKVTVLVNTGNDEENLEILGSVFPYLSKAQKNGKAFKDALISEKRRNLIIYTFADEEGNSSFEDFVEAGKGHIRIVSKNQLIANDFINKYPITEFMTSDQIDYSRGELKDGVNVNLFMVGYDEVAKTLFNELYSENQFLPQSTKNFAPKLANYYVIDKRAEGCETPFRYEYEYLPQASNTNRDYPLPEKCANIKYLSEFDVLDTLFCDKFEKLFSQNTNALDLNYIIVSYGSDLQNLKIAREIIRQLKGANKLTNYVKIFVNVQSQNTSLSILQQNQVVDECLTCELLKVNKHNRVIPFGDYETCVYDFNLILGDAIQKIATEKTFNEKNILQKAKKEALAQNSNLTNRQLKKLAMEKLREKWAGYTDVQRKHNFSACRNLRLKLNLLGFDYAENSSPLDDQSKQFKLVYFGNENAVAQFSPEIYANSSVRTLFARQEHLRWNAYMISKNVVPSNNGEGKNMAVLRHPNITNHQGVLDYTENGVKKDVMKYDYKIMDDVIKILSDCGYKIVKKSDLLTNKK